MRVVECVPNISEGRRPEVYEAVAKAAGLCPSAREKYELLLTTRFRIDVQIVNDVLRDLGEPELPG